MEKLTEAKRWMNIREAAEYSGYSVGAIYKKVWKREFPFTRPSGSRRLIFDRIAIDKYLEKYAVRAITREEAIAI